MNKFYVVPASIIESNFADDMDSIMQQSAIIETDRTITEIAELLLHD